MVDTITTTLAAEITTETTAQEASAARTSAARTPAPEPTSQPITTYIIREGDTLNGIAERYAIGVEQLMSANGLEAQDIRNLRPGQTLLIPRAPGRAAAAPSATPRPTVAPTVIPTAIPTAIPTVASARAAPLRYIVQEGDFPFSIANKFGVSVDALLAINNLTREDATRLRTGPGADYPRSGHGAAR